MLGVNGARENPERLSHLTYRETAFQHKYSSLQLLKDKLVSEVCFMVCSSYLGNISWSPQLTVIIEHCMILNDVSVAQIVASWRPGCKKMEREWENEEEMVRE